MSLKQPWIMAMATVAVAGSGTSVRLACDDRGFNDQRQPPIVELTETVPGGSAESADSPEGRRHRPGPGPRLRRFDQ